LGVDGPDPETNIDGPRLRVIVNSRSPTVATARNARTDHANDEWIAFLDDDDEWFPKKLVKQMAADRGPVLVTLSQPRGYACGVVRSSASDLRGPSFNRRISVRTPLTMIVTYQPRGRRPLARA
jgi:glycosyltransferase involved in cell wall biosynthesis